MVCAHVAALPPVSVGVEFPGPMEDKEVGGTSFINRKCKLGGH